MYDYSDRWSFLAEWFDFESAYHKKFLVNYYPCDSTIELYDRELNRIYLKRQCYEGIRAQDIYVGATIRVYGRQLKITDYANCRTRDQIGKTRDHTFGLVKPTLNARIGEIFNQIQDRGFEIAKIRMCKLQQPEALDLYDSYKGDAFLPFIIDHVTSGPVVALQLVGYDAVQRWVKDVGPMDPMEARKEAPECLRAIYGSEKATNGFHSAKSCDEAKRESKIFFPLDDKPTTQRPPASTVTFANSTCCVVKPHAVREGKLGSIISFITQGKFTVTAMQSFYLSSANADEFLEVYKGVVADFHALLESFLDGMCVALEVCGKGGDVDDVHGEFRQFVGPPDSEIARQIRPNTLRAQFGVDKYRNAVHCTDLKEDTVLELEYFFNILS